MNNTSISQEIKQVCQKNSLQLLQENPEKTIRELLTPATRKVFDIILTQTKKHRTCSPAQASIAQWARRCRKTANRTLQFLHDINFIVKTNNGPMKTCKYQINPLFERWDITSRLRHLLPGIWMPFQLALMFAPNAAFNENVPLLKVKENPPVLKNQKHPNVDYHPTKRIRGRAYAYRNFGSSLQDGWHENIKKLVRGERVIEVIISPRIEAIKVLNLTLRGKIELMPYPDEAIDEMEIIMARGNNPILDPIAYARKICRKACERLGIIPNWSVISELLAFYDVLVSAPMLKDKTIMKKPITLIGRNLPAQKRITHKQECNKPAPEWQPSSQRKFGKIKMSLPYNSSLSPERQQIANNWRAMIRATGILINDDEPLPHKGIYPLISREDSDKSYEKFMKSGKSFETSDLNDKPPLMDYSEYDEVDNMLIEF